MNVFLRIRLQDTNHETVLHTLILTMIRAVYLMAHGGCDRSTGDAYSLVAPDPTSSVSRGLCKPDFYLYGAHSGCDRWVGDAYSSMTSDSTSDIFRGPCTPILR
jgi:hypothetical protein